MFLGVCAHKEYNRRINKKSITIYIMNTKLFKQTLAEGYRSPEVIVTPIKNEGVLCGSFPGSGTQDYEDEDIWEGVN